MRRLPDPTAEELNAETPTERRRRLNREKSRRFYSLAVDARWYDEAPILVETHPMQVCDECGHHYVCHSDDEAGACRTGTGQHGQRVCGCTHARTALYLRFVQSLATTPTAVDYFVPAPCDVEAARRVLVPAT